MAIIDFGLRADIRSCVIDMENTARYLEQAANQLEVSLKGLEDMNICKRMRSDANDYRKAATELSRALR